MARENVAYRSLNFEMASESLVGGIQGSSGVQYGRMQLPSNSGRTLGFFNAGAWGQERSNGYDGRGVPSGRWDGVHKKKTGNKKPLIGYKTIMSVLLLIESVQFTFLFYVGDHAQYRTS